MMFENEIARGVALLDEARPQWYLHVDVERLDLNNCRACVLGQLYGEFSGPHGGVEMLKRYRGIGIEGPGFWEFAENHGFSLPENTPPDTYYFHLTDAWRATILNLRETRRHDKEMTA